MLLFLFLQCALQKSTPLGAGAGSHLVGGGHGREESVVRPDLNQMVPFRPSTTHGKLPLSPFLTHSPSTNSYHPSSYHLLATSGVGMNAVPGGHFPLPSAVARLMPLLPPPECFQVSQHRGFHLSEAQVAEAEAQTITVHPHIFSLLHSLCILSLPSPPILCIPLPLPQGPFVLIDELIELIMRSPVPDTPSSSSSNQTTEAGGGAGQKRKREEGEGSDEEGDGAPPSHDVYRLRQQKRIHTTS